MTPSLPRRWADRLLRRRGGTALEADDQRWIAGLRAGDEAVFSELMDRHGMAMIKVALMYVSTLAVAEEVVQETWLAVLRGIHDFRGDSSLRTWIFRILVNRAKSAARAEGRSVSFSALTAGEHGPSVEPGRFTGDGGWASDPPSWGHGPEEIALAHELLGFLREALEALTPAQRAVVLMRDVQGFTAEEVCELLRLTPGNQRVLLHRGRSRVRTQLADYMEGGERRGPAGPPRGGPGPEGT